MNIASVQPVRHAPSVVEMRGAEPTAPALGQPANSQDELRQVFHRFVGETFYGQLMQSLRKTVDKPAYFHGGRAEEVFQAQLDQVLAERMTESTAQTFSEPMFRLFQLGRVS